ncbi:MULTISPECIES: hypothetical protein [Pseudomonas]|uniref:hypothetical protein n=1 Tax=Pseudomonas TaxID=286 RepID=UPI001F2BC555|nr:MULTISPECIES: hypothetical protein [Pseudomonas]
MPVTSLLRRSSAFFGLMVSLSGLVGCALTGTYQDATGPDAAKMRFVANTDNATVNYFDAEHCDGMTTGILNNLFVRDSPRRVGMTVAPPEKARGYLEVKLPPEKEVFLQVNTQVGYGVCGAVFSFRPERATEYELTFELKGSQCSTLMQRLQRVDGKDVRTPVTIRRDGFAACEGRNPIFPKPPALLPDTPERTAMIDRIIDGSAFVLMKSGSDQKPVAAFTPEKLDALISERKVKLGFDMPEDYWTLYRQNLIEFGNETAAAQAQTLERSTNEYRQRLRSAEDKQLREWSRADDSSGKPGNAAPADQEKSMIVYYFQTSRAVTLEAVNHHMDRMAKMDAQYNVCTRYAECWKR